MLDFVTRILKFFAVFLFMLGYMGFACLVWLMPFLDQWTKRRICQNFLTKYSRIGLWLLGLKLDVSYDETLKEPSYLMVGNHLSYLDIILVASQRPTCFVTSVEIKETPFLGQACTLAGCLFVERRSRANLMTEVAEITEALKRGFNVVVFPEATSTNGDEVLRFKRPLFMGALQSGRSVLPFCINYESIDGERLSLANRDRVFWYGDMDFATHLWGFVGIGETRISLSFLKTLESKKDFEPGDLAILAHESVRSKYQPMRLAKGEVIEEETDSLNLEAPVLP